jgi:hypothetical protein
VIMSMDKVWGGGGDGGPLFQEFFLIQEHLVRNGAPHKKTMYFFTHIDYVFFNHIE